MDKLELLDDTKDMSKDELIMYALCRADTIVRNTQGDSWDDPEEWQIEAVELAHAIYRLHSDKEAYKD